MTNRDKIIFSGLFLAIFCAAIYSIRAVLSPFIISIIIAYFLDPIVKTLRSRCNISRTSATFLIIGLFFSLLITTLILVLPISFIQLGALFEALPTYIKSLNASLEPFLSKFIIPSQAQIEQNSNPANDLISQKILQNSEAIIDGAISSSFAIFNFLSFIFIAPILIFYFLKDWDAILRKIEKFLPQKIAPLIKKIANEIDHTLHGYVRGQISVCVILSIIYAILLSLVGLNFGFLIGILTGIFSFIPYLAMICGVTCAIIIGLFQWGFDLINLSLVGGAFIIGQIIEANFLTPNLIGAKIGLHPVWLIFGLFVCGALFGFIGVVIAIPLTAICGVIVKNLAQQYLKNLN